MRTIKFKGKRVDHEECTPPYKWVYGYYFKTPLTAENCGLDSFLPGETRHCIATEEGVVYEVLEDKVGQYIGLEDKNKVEIYEGDIIKYKFAVLSGVDEVIFVDGTFRLKNDYISEGGFRTVKNVSDYCEVIGNIYENPELTN